MAIRRRARNVQIVRHWRLLLALNDGHWWSVNELRQSTGLARWHRKTILRDLEFLTELIPIDCRQSDRPVPPLNLGTQFEFRLRFPLSVILGRWRFKGST